MATLVIQRVCPSLTDEQESHLDRLNKLYGKSTAGRFVDGIGGLLVSGGAFGRSDADKLSKIAKVLLDKNQFLNGHRDYHGIDKRDITEARRLIALYGKPEGLKFIDGLGNFLCGGGFGRSDALDLVIIIRKVIAVNNQLAANRNERAQSEARLQRLNTVLAPDPLSSSDVIVSPSTCECLRDIMDTKGFIQEGSNNLRDDNPGEVQGTEETRRATALSARVDPHVFDPPILRSQKNVNHPFFRTLQFKRLGHTFNLSGRRVLPEGNKIDLEGFAEVFTIPMIASSFRNHLKEKNSLFSEKDGDWLLGNMTKPILGDLLDEKELEKALLEFQDSASDNVIFLGAGYDWHVSSVLLYRNMLIYCNRGMDHQGAGVNIYHIPDRSRLNKDLLGKICRRHAVKKNEYLSEQYLKSNLNLILIHHHPMKVQTIGNCSWASNKAVLRFFLTLRHLLNQKTSSDELKQANTWKKGFTETHSTYKDWSRYDREATLKDFALDLKDLMANKFGDEMAEEILQMRNRLQQSVRNLVSKNKISIPSNLRDLFFN